VIAIVLFSPNQTAESEDKIQWTFLKFSEVHKC